MFADGRDGAPGEGEVRASERVTVGRVCSRVGSSPPSVVGVSGAAAACAWSPVWRSSAAKPSPPPTRATAVATTARRWFFFHRASCRRRAARPDGAWGTDPATGSIAGVFPGASSGAFSGSLSGPVGAAAHVAGSAYDDVAGARVGPEAGTGAGMRSDIAARAGAMPRSTVTGAMSGA